MTNVAASIVVLSTSIFTAALIKMISPSGNTEKIIKLILSLFVLICIVTCIKSVTEDISLSEYEISDINEDTLNTDENVLRVTGDYLAQYTDNLLNSQGIEASKVELTVDSDDKGVINITGLNIYLDRSKISEKRFITEFIEKDLNITPSLIFEE